MRLAVALALVAAVPAELRADSVTASASVGVGVFADQPASSLDLGLDLARDELAVGIGGRVRYLASDGVREEDWDEPSEVARIVRYASYRWQQETGPRPRQAHAVVGEVGGASVGHRALLWEYATGIDVDHGRTGVQGRYLGPEYAGEVVIDDVIAPRVVGLGLRRDLVDRFEVGADVVADRVALDADGDRSPLVGFSVGGAIHGMGRDGVVAGRGYLDLVGLAGVAAGAHMGMAGDVEVTTGHRLGLIGEVRVGSSGYAPQWFGPLYELEREQVVTDDAMTVAGLGAASASGALGGLSGVGSLTWEGGALGSAAVSYSQRPGLADLLFGRLALPGFRAAQAGVWAAAELAGASIPAAVVAAEMRARLPRRLYLTSEIARLYRGTPGSLMPMWSISVAVGGVLGE